MAVAPLAIGVLPRSSRPGTDSRPLAVSGSPPSPLRVCGRALCAGDERFRWRGVTAFGLADLVADGRETDARTFIEWAREHRVQRAACARDDAQRRLARSLPRRRPAGAAAPVRDRPGARDVRPGRRAREHERAQWPLPCESRSCGSRSERWAACARRPATASWNSPTSRITDRRRAWTSPRSCGACSRRSRRSCPWPGARRADDESHEMAGGTFVVVHVRRSGDRWTRVARMRSLAGLSAATGKFVVDNEPIGAAEIPDRGRRDSAPEAFFAQGVLSRLLDVGSTFHCEDCLPARVPGPVQRQCADAFVEGRRIVPEDVESDDRGRRVGRRTRCSSGRRQCPGLQRNGRRPRMVADTGPEQRGGRPLGPRLARRETHRSEARGGGVDGGALIGAGRGTLVCR